jgi:hypothetical protein
MSSETGILDVRAIARRFAAHSVVDERHEPVVRGTYEREILRSPRPILLHGLAKGWPAYQRWTFDYLAQRGEGVEVVTARSIVEQSKTRRESRDLGDYIRSMQARDGTVTGGSDQSYVSYCPLLEMLPDLRADLPLDELFPSRLYQYLTAWIGPAGTVTGLHSDNMPNVLTQIRGRKGLLLLPPPALERYRSPKFDLGARLSQVDLRDPDLARFPQVRELAPLVAIVEEGDGLYIPPHWWHFVVAETPSVSLSNLAGHLRHAVLGMMPQWPLFLLHTAGLYARGNCVCHN